MAGQYETTRTTPETAAEPQSDSTSVDKIDARAPRFGQALTTTFLAIGILLQQPLFIGLVFVALTTAAVTSWRIDPWGIVWKRAGIPIAGKPTDLETAAPHRFAKLMGVAGTGIASLAFLANLDVIGYGVALLVTIAAGIGATTGFCLGCKLYGQVRYVQRLDLV